MLNRNFKIRSKTVRNAVQYRKILCRNVSFFMNRQGITID